MQIENNQNNYQSLKHKLFSNFDKTINNYLKQNKPKKSQLLTSDNKLDMEKLEQKRYIFKEFKINKEIYNNQLTQDQKISYIKNCLLSKLKSDIKEHFSNNKSKIIKQNNERNQNLYNEWVKITTNYDHLKTELKKKLISFINESDKHNKPIKEIIEIINNEEVLFKKDNFMLKENWNDNDERKFQEIKNINKSKFINKLKSSNLNDLSLYPFINDLKSFENNAKFKNYLLEKFMDGQWITKEELNYLTVTSEFTNKILDKRYYNYKISKLNPKVINKLEVEISNDIINKHHKLIEYLKKIRNIYINEQNIKKKKVTEICNYIEKEEDKLFRKIKIKNYLKKDFTISKNKNNTNNVNANNIKNNILFGEIEYNSINKINKPYTRLLTSIKNSNNNFELDFILKNKYNKNIKNKIINSKQNFNRVYSTGPKGIYRSILNKNNIHVQIRAAVIIQAFARKIIAKSFYNNLKLLPKEKRIKTLSSKFDNTTTKLTVNKSKTIKNKSYTIIKKLEKNKTIQSLIPQFENSSNNNYQQLLKPKKKKIATNPGLLIKHISLLNACKAGKYSKIIQSGYEYDSDDVNITDEKGNTPLLFACLTPNIEIVNYLLAKGALINKKCMNNNTAMHAAFKSGNLEVIRILIKNGGDMGCVNTYGYTPIGLGDKNILKILGINQEVIYVEDKNDIKVKNNIFEPKKYPDINKNYSQYKFEKVKSFNNFNSDKPYIF